MKNCITCKEKSCAYRGAAFKDLTIYCSEHCPKQLKNECEQIATPEFRATFEQLKNGGFELGSVNGILRQMTVILNAADDIRA